MFEEKSGTSKRRGAKSGRWQFVCQVTKPPVYSNPAASVRQKKIFWTKFPAVPRRTTQSRLIDRKTREKRVPITFSFLPPISLITRTIIDTFAELSHPSVSPWRLLVSDCDLTSLVPLFLPISGGSKSFNGSFVKHHPCQRTSPLSKKWLITAQKTSPRGDSEKAKEVEKELQGVGKAAIFHPRLPANRFGDCRRYRPLSSSTSPRGKTQNPYSAWERFSLDNDKIVDEGKHRIR